MVHIVVNYSLFFQICDILGTLAFAISGLRLAASKDFDWFGAYVVGLTTAIGGGTIRDLLLDITPFWMTNPFYIICSGLALLLVILFKQRWVSQEHTWFLFDAIGLGFFTVTGIERSLSVGGILRDVLINETPLIFRKDIYATACIIGGIVFHICDAAGLGHEITAVIVCLVVIAIRMLSVRYHIQLPVLHLKINKE